MNYPAASSGVSFNGKFHFYRRKRRGIEPVEIEINDKKQKGVRNGCQ